jgi:hypothetical protein
LNSYIKDCANDTLKGEISNEESRGEKGGRLKAKKFPRCHPTVVEKDAL